MKNPGRYVYLFRNEDGSVGYVGIGGPERPGGQHATEVDRIRNRGCAVEISSRAFSTRADAELAESLIVRALAAHPETRAKIRNTAKMKSTADLIPFMPMKEGTLRYSTLERAVIVKIAPGEIDKERAVITGLTDPVAAAKRCREWWPLRSCVDGKLNIDKLVAVTTSGVQPVRVVGIWTTHPPETWTKTNEYGRRSINLVDPREGDVGGHAGKIFDCEGYKPQLVGYSRDLR